MHLPLTFLVSLILVLLLPHAVVLAEPSPTQDTQRSVQQSRPAIADITSCAPKPTDYPTVSLLFNEQGTSRIRFAVDSDGKLESASVAKSSGHQRLDEAAIRSLSTCQFRSGRDSEGKPKGGNFVVEYVWKLSN
jgi:periplasmic protein TonB